MTNSLPLNLLRPLPCRRQEQRLSASRGKARVAGVYAGSSAEADSNVPKSARIDVSSSIDPSGASLSICRILNGMWQTSSTAWGRPEGGTDSVVSDMIAHADAGLTTFDMADIYGPAESYYGLMMDTLRRKRGEEAAAQVQGCTKYVPSPARMTREVVEAAVKRSCARMQVNRLDMLQFHWWDYSNLGYLDALKHLTDLKEEGRIQVLALTNFDTNRLQKVIEAGIPIASNQVQHSLVDMRPQQHMAELCSLTGVKLITYGTVMGGLLSEAYIDAREPNTMLGPRLTTPSLNKYKQMVDAWGGWPLFQQLLRECRTVARKHGVPISAVAIRYILDQPSVAGSMVGARFGISQRIKETWMVFTFELDDEDKARIERVISQGKDLGKIIGDCGDEYR